MLIRKKWVVGALILIVAGGVFVGVKKTSGKSQTARTFSQAYTGTQNILEFLPSDLVEVTLHRVQQRLPFSGALHAVNQALIKARVGGDIREVLAREGMFVNAGQVLIRMDDREYVARAKQAEGALAAARGQLDIAAKNKNNNQALVEKGFISKNAFDQADSQFVVATANVASAQATLDIARKAWSDTVLVAPISGWVSRRLVEPGEKVAPDNVLLNIVDLNQMELEAAVPAEDIARVHLGQEVRIKVDGVGVPVSGRVVRLNPEVQSGSRSFLVYVRIDNQQGVLRAGMFGEAQLVLLQKEAVLSVPESAIQKDAGVSYVFAIEQQRLVKKTVTLGMRGHDGDLPVVEVLSGLLSGAQVIRSNLGTLRVDTPVKIVSVLTSTKG